MANILDKIIANKRREVEAADSLLGTEVAITTDRVPLSFRQAARCSPTLFISAVRSLT